MNFRQRMMLCFTLLFLDHVCLVCPKRLGSRLGLCVSMDSVAAGLDNSDATLVFCRESRRDFRISPPRDKLPRVNAWGFQLEANCMHVVKLNRVAMQP